MSWLNEKRILIRRVFLVLAAVTAVAVFLVSYYSWDAGLVGSAIVAVASGFTVRFFAPKRPGADPNSTMPGSEQMSPRLANGSFGGLRGITSARQPRALKRKLGWRERQ